MKRHSLILLSLLDVTCATHFPQDHWIEYRVASLEGDVLGSPHEECRVDNGMDYVYRYPSGREVEVHASQSPLFTLSLASPVEVLVTDYGEIEPGIAHVAVASVLPSIPDLDQARAARAEFARCDLLVLVDGQPVGIERRGTNWSRKLPGGVRVRHRRDQSILGISGLTSMGERPRGRAGERPEVLGLA